MCVNRVCMSVFSIWFDYVMYGECFRCRVTVKDVWFVVMNNEKYIQWNDSTYHYVDNNDYFFAYPSAYDGRLSFIACAYVSYSLFVALESRLHSVSWLSLLENKNVWNNHRTIFPLKLFPWSFFYWLFFPWSTFCFSSHQTPFFSTHYTTQIVTNNNNYPQINKGIAPR